VTQEWINGAAVSKGTQISDSTALVNQAAGMLSVQLELPIAVALEWLRSYAFVHGQFAAEFAADIVARRRSFGVGDR
jgi:hypothetical protein